MDVKLVQTLLCQYFLPSSALIWESGACEAVAWSGSDILEGWATKLAQTDTGASAEVAPARLALGVCGVAWRALLQMRPGSRG